MTIRRIAVVGISVAALALAACAPNSEGAEGSGTVTLVTHDSFYLPDDVLASFTAETGYEITLVAPGDAGDLVRRWWSEAQDAAGRLSVRTAR